MFRYLYRTWQLRRLMRRRAAAVAQRSASSPTARSAAAVIDSTAASTSQPLPASPQQRVDRTTETLRQQAEAISRFQAQLDASVPQQRSTARLQRLSLTQCPPSSLPVSVCPRLPNSWRSWRGRERIPQPKRGSSTVIHTAAQRRAERIGHWLTSVPPALLLLLRSDGRSSCSGRQRRSLEATAAPAAPASRLQPRCHKPAQAQSHRRAARGCRQLQSSQGAELLLLLLLRAEADRQCRSYCSTGESMQARETDREQRATTIARRPLSSRRNAPQLRRTAQQQQQRQPPQPSALPTQQFSLSRSLTAQVLLSHSSRHNNSTISPAFLDQPRRLFPPPIVHMTCQSPAQHGVAAETSSQRAAFVFS